MPDAVTRTGSTARPELLASLDPLLRAWLPRQRWFAGRTTPALTLLAATDLLPVTARQPGLIHALLRVEPTQDTYQLLLGVRESLPPYLAPALIGHVTQGPLAGRTVYEALLDPRLTDLLLERLRHPGRLGGLRFAHDGATPIPPDLAPRPLDAEQSNSSIIYGDTFILKVFRRVTPGLNPDLELQRALADEGCGRALAPVAWFETTDDDPLSLGLLQPYLTGATDGWDLALGELSKGQDFRHEARELGRATAEIHLALAHALPTVTLGRAHTVQLAHSMKDRLDKAVQAVPALHPYAPALHTAFDALAADTTPRTAQRVHGDLHLGQCLRSPAGAWSVIDFEGEPSRPLPERRLPHPPARDVAGMLRSFDYAARTSRPWAPDWARGCRDAYCAGYAQAAGDDPRTDPVLLRAYETDKAVYEAVYEAHHRPDWLSIPLSAIDRLATEASGMPRPRTGDADAAPQHPMSTPSQEATP
ncbi:MULTISPECIES: maltokinase [unclassified Streptomyces]|uniref:maltokinase N-terminal cap-like domain-containing protein n=1 Tax=unclassified Streptomyces TaxID=2593676 RepID=UPI00131D41E5|nr:maltokinase [Streptomyces sp. CB01635]